jgi:hypothetical protein
LRGEKIGKTARIEAGAALPLPKRPDDYGREETEYRFPGVLVDARNVAHGGRERI